MQEINDTESAEARTTSTTADSDSSRKTSPGGLLEAINSKVRSCFYLASKRDAKQSHDGKTPSHDDSKRPSQTYPQTLQYLPDVTNIIYIASQR
jgi:hypothetical protein